MDMYDEEMEKMHKEYLELYNEYQRTKEEFQEALQKIITKQKKAEAKAVVSSDIKEKLHNLFLNIG